MKDKTRSGQGRKAHKSRLTQAMFSDILVI